MMAAMAFGDFDEATSLGGILFVVMLQMTVIQIFMMRSGSGAISLVAENGSTI